jgi:hypothetical protein
LSLPTKWANRSRCTTSGIGIGKSAKTPNCLQPSS